MLTANARIRRSLARANAAPRGADSPVVARFDDDNAPGGERLRAACLAAYDALSPRRWEHAGDDVVKVRLREADFSLGDWMILQPVRPKLVQPLTNLFRTDLTPREQYVVSRVLAKVGVAQPNILAELCLEATPAQVLNLGPAFAPPKRRSSLASKNCWPTRGATAELRERRRARPLPCSCLDRGTSAWRFFRFSSDPSTRSFLIHDLAACQVRRLRAYATVCQRAGCVGPACAPSGAGNINGSICQRSRGVLSPRVC